MMGAATDYALTFTEVNVVPNALSIAEESSHDENSVSQKCKSNKIWNMQSATVQVEFVLLDAVPISV